MKRHLRTFAVVGTVLGAITSSGAAFAQKPGGILRIPHGDSPASMSTHEEATRSTATPMMGVFNNLVIFDQHVPQNILSSIVPDLAVAWSWDEDKTALTFRLRQDVRWHDGRPFSPKDVKCTWDLLTGKSSEKLRVNPRKSWYRNLEKVTVDSDNQVTFHLKRPQPFFTALLASGASPVYPCHVSPAQMRQHPIGTGPFKFVEYKPNELIRLIRNPDYWKPGRPYLDGIEYTIIPNLSTRMLAFTAGKVDMTFPYGVSIPLLKEVKSQAPQAICETTVATGSRTLIVNHTARWDEDGAGVHDVIGTRCDPYTNLLLKGMEYHHCCHSNLMRALAAERNLPLDEAEVNVHDVMNVFMCTGYTRDTHQYFMKASPVRPGDFIEFFAEIDLLVALSACPGGDCGASHSDDTAKCYPLKVEIHRPHERALAGWQSPGPNKYSRSHGTR